MASKIDSAAPSISQLCFVILMVPAFKAKPSVNQFTLHTSLCLLGDFEPQGRG